MGGKGWRRIGIRSTFAVSDANATHVWSEGGTRSGSRYSGVTPNSAPCRFRKMFAKRENREEEKESVREERARVREKEREEARISTRRGFDGGYTSGIVTGGGRRGRGENVPGNIRLLSVLSSTLHPLRLSRFRSAARRVAESGILIFTSETRRNTRAIDPSVPPPPTLPPRVA